MSCLIALVLFFFYLLFLLLLSLVGLKQKPGMKIPTPRCSSEQIFCFMFLLAEIVRYTMLPYDTYLSIPPIIALTHTDRISVKKIRCSVYLHPSLHEPF